jgi:nucleoside-diphosphate-sugar epimerase
MLMLPSLLQAAGSGKLRIFGDGCNMISFCHVDNYCHGLILGAQALYPRSPALGKYYVITDSEPQYFWTALDQAITGMGFTSLFSKLKIPSWLIMAIAYLVVFLGDLFSFISGDHSIVYSSPNVVFILYNISLTIRFRV